MKCLPKLDATVDQNNVEHPTSTQFLEKNVDHLVDASQLENLTGSSAQSLLHGSALESVLKAKLSVLWNIVDASPKRTFSTCSVPH